MLFRSLLASALAAANCIAECGLICHCRDMSSGEKASHTGKHSQETYSGTYVCVYGMTHGHDRSYAHGGAECCIEYGGI